MSWFRICFCAAILLQLFIFANAKSLQSEVDGRLFGKTRSEALAMGEGRWMQYTANQPGGSSTVGMVDAMNFYLDPLTVRTDRALSKKSKISRERLKKLRTTLNDYSVEVIALEEYLNGGGTMFRLFYPSAAITNEQIVYRLVVGQVGKTPPQKTSRVLKAISTYKLVTETPVAEKVSKKEISVRMGKIRRLASACFALLKELPRKSSDLVLNRMLDLTRRASSEG